jgi:endo-1,4-beta-xylanase
MLRSLICLIVVLLGFSTAFAAEVPKSIPLWSNGAPGSEGKTAPETGKPDGPERGYTNITNVHNPSIIPYLPPKEKSTGVAVIVLPGGGHRNLAIGHEGYNVGEWLAERGIAAFVVKYRLAREPGSTYKIENEALADTQRAIRTVRSRAAEWNVNVDAVGVIGFSAGAELAALSSMRMEGGIEGASDPIDQQSAKPNFQALIYPGQSGKIQPTKDSPPAFLAAGNLDRPDISEGLADVYLRFKRAGVPVELHIYAKTGHGFGLRESNRPPAGNWPTQFQQWLVNLGLMK